MALKLTVLDSSTLGADIDLSMFECFGELRIFTNTAPEDFVKNVGDSDVIILNKVKAGRHNLPECKNVKLICETATGFDNIDVEYCRQKGIVVDRTVGSNARSVAETAISFILAEILSFCSPTPLLS